MLLLVSMAFFMVIKFSESNDRMSDIVDNSSSKISLSNYLIRETLNVIRLEKNLILEKDPVQQRRIREEIQQALSAISLEKIKLNDLVDPVGQAMLEEFNNNWENYESEIREVIDLIENGEVEQATGLSLRAAKTRRAANNHLEQLIDKNENDIQTEKLQNNAEFKSALTSIGFLIILSIGVAFFISYWIIQSIGSRISGIALKAEKIASREYTNEEVTDTVKDELNPIVNSLVNVNKSFREVTENANKVASGEYDLDLSPRSNKDLLGMALSKMTGSLREKTASNEKHNWLTRGHNQLNEKLMGNQNIEELADNLISFLSTYLNANIGAVYLFNEQNDYLELKGRYAFSSPEKTKEKFSLKEGLIGQAAREKRQLSISDIKEKDLRITSSLIDAVPKHLVIIPFLYEEKILGVLELGKLSHFSDREQEFLDTTIESIALSVHSAIARNQIQELLSETQVQSEELQTQQEELKQMNEELEEQTQNLKQQQEELQMTNEELEEQTQSLEVKNKEVEAAKFDVEQKTKQLEISSKYKSEFLANMSHELRTPLNSLLILSKDLADNKNKNLDEDQVESAEIINKSGQDLLVLINEVLDLSRVEAGKMNIHKEKVFLNSFVENLLRGFKHQATQKGLILNSQLGDHLPEYVHTDPQRLNQILKNLLSNAIKFTEKGSITINIERGEEKNIVISVKDTGIGIKKEKQMAIFEAFQQADGGTARKYGGTGLGLSISRELAKLLGAEIKLESTFEQGATFSVYLSIGQESDENMINPRLVREPETPKLNTEKFLNVPGIKDDRENIKKEDKLVLIIEDDLKFAGILLKQAHEKGFKAIAAASGEDGLVLANKYRPHAIILDIDLPGMNGHQVLAEIKSNPEIRHIPVHIASVNERTLDPIRQGAVEYLMKPVAKKELEEAFTRIESFVSRKMKNLLLVEDDKNSRIAVRKLIGNGDVHSIEAASGEEALKLYKENHIDCIVLDIGLPDMSGFELIYKLEKLNGKVPPIIIYTGKELTKEENNELEKYAESIIIKGVKSEERLLDETALFLHRTISNLPESKQRIISNLYDKETVFHNKKVLVVDDDMRNVFALSKILKDRGIIVVKAEHGKNALEKLDEDLEIDLVLMDIMMPEMDGYEAMREIRKQRQFKNLPIIALTAKAMKEDKKKCIDAGANDYITKPVDVQRLLSLMQVWLSK